MGNNAVTTVAEAVAVPASLLHNAWWTSVYGGAVNCLFMSGVVIKVTH